MHQDSARDDGADPGGSADVIVVGAGLAGLAAARHLTRAGLDVTVLEGGPGVGGRMATSDVDGYRLDHGPGLFCPAWPEPAALGLPLRPFDPGVVLRADGPRTLRVGDAPGSRPSRTGTGALHAARALGSRPADTSARGRTRTAVADAVDAARLRTSLARLAAVPPERLRGPERAAHEAVPLRGLPTSTVRALVHPVLAVLLSDPDLGTSSTVAAPALHGFARRGLAVPAGGADALPRLLADSLPVGRVRTGVRVRAVSTDSVTTEEHGTLRCRAVVVATAAHDAAELLPGLRVPGFHPVTVLHHAADAPPPATGTALLVDAARRGPVSHTWTASAVDPSRCPRGRTLVTSVVLGAAAGEALVPLEKAARGQLADLHRTGTDRWELLAAHREPRAVPVMPAPHDPHRPVRVLSGLYVCGDHRDTSGPQGALTSARRAAGRLLRDFGLRPAADRLGTAA